MAIRDRTMAQDFLIQNYIYKSETNDKAGFVADGIASPRNVPRTNLPLSLSLSLSAKKIIRRFQLRTRENYFGLFYTSSDDPLACRGADIEIQDAGCRRIDAPTGCLKNSLSDVSPFELVAGWYLWRARAEIASEKDARLDRSGTRSHCGVISPFYRDRCFVHQSTSPRNLDRCTDR